MSDTRPNLRAPRARMRPIAAIVAAVALACGVPGASGAKAGNDDVARAALGIAVVAIVGVAIADALNNDDRRDRHGRQVARPSYGHGHAGPPVRRGPVVVHRAPVRVIGRGHDDWRDDRRHDRRHDRRGDIWRADRRDHDARHDDGRGRRGDHGVQTVWRADRGDGRHDAGARDPWRGDSRGDRHATASAAAPYAGDGRAAAVQREMERRRQVRSAR